MKIRFEATVVSVSYTSSRVCQVPFCQFGISPYDPYLFDNNGDHAYPKEIEQAMRIAPRLSCVMHAEFGLLKGYTSDNAMARTPAL